MNVGVGSDSSGGSGGGGALGLGGVGGGVGGGGGGVGGFHAKFNAVHPEINKWPKIRETQMVYTPKWREGR